MSAQQIKFEEIVVARPFILVEHEFSGTTIVGIKSRRATEVGESLKFPQVFARELISGKKAVKAGSDDAKDIAAAVKAAKAAAKAEATPEAAAA